MLKKYYPIVALIAAIALLVWVKKNQRGRQDHIPVKIDVPQPANEPFARDTALLVYSKHALCRMDCRHIDESEVKELLQNGQIDYKRTEESPKGKTYAFEGITRDDQHVRVIFAPHEEEVVVVTVIDLEKEWACDCN